MTHGMFFFQIDDNGLLDVVDLTNCGCAIPILEQFSTMVNFPIHVSGLLQPSTPLVQGSESTLLADTQDVNLTPTEEPVGSSETTETIPDVSCSCATGQDASVSEAQLETQNFDADQNSQEVLVTWLRTSA
ncbi:hypothetical protein [Neorickettsia sennetsu]|uniref:Uncharacterized protein n=1 Tax=Ehrlichia sennetsu (strain ATCC VR-367 / Miyayama) TaxID=222891 RepID=Q2GEK6_EHRS3|nr:hypothetical protein [Neorickettsia sennetsu]ABD46229.1 hypothetical protein NSE_0195 [Neorickettsia sennetsu str. Miyayama]